jgi:hypothetical protein
VPGTPTGASTTTFTVTGDQTNLLVRDAPIRYSSNSGTDWSYSVITAASYATGTTTVTIGDAILPASGALNSGARKLQFGADCGVQNDRWQYVGSAMTPLTTLRFPGVPRAALVVEASDSTLSNPADLIKFLLTDPDQGLGQTVDTASFTQAATDFATANITLQGAIGADGKQRRALDIFNEILSMRGADLWRDPDSGHWKIQVDTGPTTMTTPLEYGQGTRGNIADVPSVSRTPLRQAVTTLELRYSPGGRVRNTGSGWSFFQQDYDYHATATVLSGLSGVTQTLTAQYINAHENARRVLYYRAKRLARSDQSIGFTMKRAGQRVRRNQVYPFTIPLKGVSDNYRIIARTRTMTGFTFSAVGPYNADIYDTNDTNIQAFVSQPTQEKGTDELPIPDGGINLLLNADFSTGISKASAPTAIDDTILPDWEVLGPDAGSALSYTEDNQCIGGGFLTVTVPNPSPSGVILWSYYQLPPNGSAIGMPVTSSTSYIISAYIDSNATGGSGCGWVFQIQWTGTSGSTTASGLAAGEVKIAPGDTNAKGWQRYYIVINGTKEIFGGFTDINSAQLSLWFQEPGKTFHIDAVQFEQVGRTVTGRPSQWSRNPLYGIRPANMLPGTQTMRVAGEQEHGTQVTYGTSANGKTGVTLSGSSTTLASVPNGTCTGVTARVATLVAGPASWKLQFDFGSGNTLDIATGIALTAGTTVNVPLAGVPITGTTHLIAVPASGTFSAGAVQATAHVLAHVAPTG